MKLQIFRLRQAHFIIAWMFITLTNCDEPPTLPTVATINASDITDTSANSGGMVTSDGRAECTGRGVCWGEKENPTLNDQHTTDGSGTGTFYSHIGGLTAGIIYHVRAWATNSEGTGYGSDLSFHYIGSCPGMETLTYGGQVYHTVLIGTQCWMKENLNIGIMINGSYDQQNNGIIEKYCYANDTNNCNTYGGLYQWDEMMKYSTAENNQGICPEDWHIPTHNDMIHLSNFLGGTKIAGGKLKEKGTLHWGYLNVEATDEFGFTALPGGLRSNIFYGRYEQGWWWTTNWLPDFPDGAEDWGMRDFDSYFFANMGMGFPNHQKADGVSIRCIKDELKDGFRVP